MIRLGGHQVDRPEQEDAHELQKTVRQNGKESSMHPRYHLKKITISFYRIHSVTRSSSLQEIKFRHRSSQQRTQLKQGGMDTIRLILVNTFLFDFLVLVLLVNDTRILNDMLTGQL